VLHQFVESGGHDRGIFPQHTGHAGQRRIGRKQRQHGHQALGLRVQQLPAPADHLGHRSVARVVPGARPAARQQGQVGDCCVGCGQQGHHVGWRVTSHTRRCQLDGQRHALQHAHQGDDRTVVAFAEVKVPRTARARSTNSAIEAGLPPHQPLHLPPAGQGSAVTPCSPSSGCAAK
jgi:hypothetical protein